MKEKGWEVTNEGAVKILRKRRWSNNNPNTQQQKTMEYRPQETAYLESTIGVPDQQQSRSLVPDTRYPVSSMAISIAPSSLLRGLVLDQNQNLAPAPPRAPKSLGSRTPR